MNYYTLKEINNLIKDGKIIIIRKDNIYDITNYKSHPGGVNCFQKKNGEEVSLDYKFHSNKAKKIWSLYFIGKIYKENNYFNSCLIS